MTRRRTEGGVRRRARTGHAHRYAALQEYVLNTAAEVDVQDVVEDEVEAEVDSLKDVSDLYGDHQGSFVPFLQNILVLVLYNLWNITI